MKYLYTFLLIFLIFSCSSTDEEIKIDDQPIVEEPENPAPIKKVKLPKSIEYKQFNYLDSIFYTSNNHYTYDSLNRITTIVIKSSINNQNVFDYQYNIIYQDTTSIAKGFEIQTFNHSESLTKNEFVKLKYIEATNSSENNFVYYQYVNNLSELKDNNFIADNNQRIPFANGKHQKKLPTGCGTFYSEYDFGPLNYSTDSRSIFELEFIESGNMNYLRKGRRLMLNNFSGPDPTAFRAPFTDVKFDYTFWIFFLKEQLFHYEINSNFKFFQVWNQDHDLGNRTITFKPEDNLSKYIDNKYPTYKKYSGKYWEQKDNVLSFYEYNVTY